MMSDPGAAVPMSAMINSILSECVWGTVSDAENTTPTWEMNSPIPSKNPPVTDLISYGEFLENVLRVPKIERKHAKTNFTAEGFAGEACREHYIQLMGRMQNIPSSQLIMPAFFHFILELETRKLDFGIVFRTFGSDSTEITKEYNEFLQRHDMTMKCIDLDRAVGKIVRGGLNGAAETYSLHLGSFNEKLCEIHGAENIYRHLMAMLFIENKRALILQDDYPYWHACGETDHSGKLLFIDPKAENNSIVQIFFDDNVERDRAHIIDVRRLPELEKVTFEEANDKLYMRISPFDVITDHDYFTKAFDDILSRRNIFLSSA